MLSLIPAEDRDTWVAVGMSLKHEFADGGFVPFDTWSQTARNYDERAVREVWRSFNGHGMTLGTLIHLARKNGWTQSDNSIPEPSVLASTRESSTVAYAKRLFRASIRDDRYIGNHAYSKTKGIDWAAGAGRGSASGSRIGQNSDCVIVPIRNIRTGNVQGVECIDVNGTKQTFGSKKNGALLLGNSLNSNSTWYVVEGWASAASMVGHHGFQVAICSFGKSCQRTVAKGIADVYRPDRLVICREED